jgi:uncharacterized protein YndB with AHSA1/START domain
MRDMPPMTLADLDRAPFRFTATAVLPCTPLRLFEEMAEPERWTTWFPLMRRARWTSQETARVGARREVTLLGLGRFEETILAYEPGRRFAFTMIATTSPLPRQMAEDYRIGDVDGRARLDWTVASAPTTLGRFTTAGLPLLFRGLWRGAVRGLRRRLASG